MRYASIFEDVFYIVTGVTETDYLLYDENDSLLYAGRAVARPDQGACSINVSRLVQNYLDSTLPTSAFSGTDFVVAQHIEPKAVMGFTLTDGKGTPFEEYLFINIWDYKTPFALIYGAGVNYPLSKPINDHRTTGMYNFQSVFDKVTHKVRTTISSASGNSCGKGALYYSNNLAGWDCFLIEGTITKKDSYERYTIDNKWVAGTLKSGTRTMVNTINESWTLTTHNMTDTESKMLAEQLYGSSNIFFHDFDTDTIVPVVITDTSVTYKTYMNNKRKKFFHTINIQSTQPKQRI